MLKRLLMAATIASMVLIGNVQADDAKPGKGITVQPARATWNTGFFQEALVHKGLAELGYKVKKAKDLANPIFYKSLSLGDIDYWTNGWFPNHDGQLPKGFYDKANKIGYVVKAGGLQGYLVSKKHVDEFGIKSLDDLKRDEVKKAFDKNGDGKADLTACPPGWGCEKVIAHHMEVYGLADSINPVKASYEAGMASALAEYKGEEHLKLASVIEGIHTASLLHDDVVDGADSRRGKPSANSMWNNHIVILVGDYMYSNALKIAVSCKNQKVNEELSSTTTRMTLGELTQLQKSRISETKLIGLPTKCRHPIRITSTRPSPNVTGRLAERIEHFHH